MALPLNPYCTVDEVRAKLRNREAAAEGEILTAIGSASRFVDDWLGRDFFFRDFSTTPFRVQNDHIFGDEIILPFLPIITLTSLTYAGVVQVLDTDYYLTQDSRGRTNRIRSLAGPFPESIPPINLILVYGTFGFPQIGPSGTYLATAIPKGMPEHYREATAEIAAAMTGRNQKEIIGTDGNKQTVTDTTIPKTALAILGARKPILI